MITNAHSVISALRYCKKTQLGNTATFKCIHFHTEQKSRTEISVTCTIH